MKEAWGPGAQRDRESATGLSAPPLCTRCHPWGPRLCPEVSLLLLCHAPEAISSPDEGRVTCHPDTPSLAPQDWGDSGGLSAVGGGHSLAWQPAQPSDDLQSEHRAPGAGTQPGHPHAQQQHGPGSAVRQGPLYRGLGTRTGHPASSPVGMGCCSPLPPPPPRHPMSPQNARSQGESEGSPNAPRLLSLGAKDCRLRGQASCMEFCDRPWGWGWGWTARVGGQGGDTGRTGGWLRRLQPGARPQARSFRARACFIFTMPLRGSAALSPSAQVTGPRPRASM